MRCYSMEERKEKKINKQKIASLKCVGEAIKWKILLNFFFAFVLCFLFRTGKERRTYKSLYTTRFTFTRYFDYFSYFDTFSFPFCCYIFLIFSFPFGCSVIILMCPLSRRCTFPLRRLDCLMNDSDNELCTLSVKWTSNCNIVSTNVDEENLCVLFCTLFIYSICYRCKRSWICITIAFVILAPPPLFLMSSTNTCMWCRGQIDEKRLRKIIMENIRKWIKLLAI